MVFSGIIPAKQNPVILSAGGHVRQSKCKWHNLLQGHSAVCEHVFKAYSFTTSNGTLVSGKIVRKWNLLWSGQPRTKRQSSTDKKGAATTQRLTILSPCLSPIKFWAHMSDPVLIPTLYPTIPFDPRGLAYLTILSKAASTLPKPWGSASHRTEWLWGEKPGSPAIYPILQALRTNSEKALVFL